MSLVKYGKFSIICVGIFPSPRNSCWGLGVVVVVVCSNCVPPPAQAWVSCYQAGYFFHWLSSLSQGSDRPHGRWVNSSIWNFVVVLARSLLEACFNGFNGQIHWIYETLMSVFNSDHTPRWKILTLNYRTLDGENIITLLINCFSWW